MSYHSTTTTLPASSSRVTVLSRNVAGESLFHVTVRNTGANPITSVHVYKAGHADEELVEDVAAGEAFGTIAAGEVGSMDLVDEPLGSIVVKAVSTSGTTVVTSIRGGL